MTHGLLTFVLTTLLLAPTGMESSVSATDPAGDAETDADLLEAGFSARDGLVVWHATVTELDAANELLFGLRFFTQSHGYYAYCQGWEDPAGDTWSCTMEPSQGDLDGTHDDVAALPVAGGLAGQTLGSYLVGYAVNGEHGTGGGYETVSADLLEADPAAGTIEVGFSTEALGLQPGERLYPEFVKASRYGCDEPEGPLESCTSTPSSDRIDFRGPSIVVP